MPADNPRFGVWRILAELARGGMAAVFLAVRDGTPPAIVAIKQIHGHLAHDPDFVAMLVDEARIASLIHHPNVVEILEYNLGESGMQNYLVMEYAEGEPLNLVMRAAVAKGIRLDYDLAASIAADVASGLHCAHELRGPDGAALGLVHRDVSPQNIIVTYDGGVKLLDFGIAKAVGRLQRTHPGEIKGKLAYMSPEQAFGRPVDRRSDVYSLGIVLYELALGRRLFGGKNDAETVRNIMNQVIPPPRTVDPDFPAGLEEIILGMLTADVDQRFQSAGAVERALRAFALSAGPGNLEARRGELVRGLDPARYQSKTSLVARERTRATVSAPLSASVQATEAPTLARIPNVPPATAAAATVETPMVVPPPSHPSPSLPPAQPVAQTQVGPGQSPPLPIPSPRGSLPPTDLAQTFQAPNPLAVSKAPRMIDATVQAAPPAEALQAIAASKQPAVRVSAPVPKPAASSRTGLIVGGLLAAGIVLSGALYVVLRLLQ